jgi:hypothetical protein
MRPALAVAVGVAVLGLSIPRVRAAASAAAVLHVTVQASVEAVTAAARPSASETAARGGWVGTRPLACRRKVRVQLGDAIS